MPMSFRAAIIGSSIMSFGVCLVAGLPIAVFYYHDDLLVSLIVYVVLSVIIFAGMMGLWYLTDGRPDRS